MRTFKLPGFDLIHDVVPHEREDESREPVKKKKARAPKGRGKKKDMAEEEVDEASNDYEIVKEGKEVPEEERSMGGPLRRVYWPPGMEEWLKPKKRDQTIKRKADDFDVDL
jgi:UV DNA damage endonuclease